MLNAAEAFAQNVVTRVILTIITAAFNIIPDHDADAFKDGRPEYDYLYNG